MNRKLIIGLTVALVASINCSKRQGNRSAKVFNISDSAQTSFIFNANSELEEVKHIKSEGDRTTWDTYVFYKNGGIYKHTRNFRDSLTHTKWYYKNGILERDVKYKRYISDSGEVHYLRFGKRKNYTNNGQISLVESYLKGILVDTLMKYNNEGKLIIFEVRDKQGNIIKEEHY